MVQRSTSTPSQRFHVDRTYDDFRCEISNFFDWGWVRRNVSEWLFSTSKNRGEFSLVLCRNTDCDYSSAYVELLTDSDLVGYGMTFTLGRGNDIVSYMCPFNKFV